MSASPQSGDAGKKRYPVTPQIGKVQSFDDHIYSGIWVYIACQNRSIRNI